MISLLGVLRKLRFKLAKCSSKYFILKNSCKVVCSNEFFVSNVSTVYGFTKMVRCKYSGCDAPYWRY